MARNALFVVPELDQRLSSSVGALITRIPEPIISMNVGSEIGCWKAHIISVRLITCATSVRFLYSKVRHHVGKRSKVSVAMLTPTKGDASVKKIIST